jgi:tRNA pseudouridine55 synthase
MTDGIINVNKPEGWTSQDICTKLRHRLHIKKIGHTGTLDPMATGVLPVCIGKATRIIEYYDDDRKTYHACMKLGYTSDTLDIWGNTERSGDFSDVTEDMIMSAFAAYTGIIEQIPPKYSALRINGKRAYDLAREGQDFEIKSRRIMIYANTVTGIDLAAGEVEFDVTCSKGTYIRTICDDIGRTLGCGAVMSSLERTASGYFRIGEAYGIDELVRMTDEELAGCIIPMDRTLENLGIIELDDNRFTAFINGNPSGTGYRVVSESDFRAGDRDKYQGCSIYKVYSRGIFLGTGYVKGRDLIPAKVIYR